MNTFLNPKVIYHNKVESVLENIGLSKNESKVYLELLTLGKSTATELSKSSKIHRSNVYDALDKLIQKGVVAHSIEGGTKNYEAADPSNLLTILKERQIQLEKFLPQLQLKRKFAPSESTVHIFNGLTPAKNTLFELLDKGKPIYVVGTPPMISKVAKGFLQEFHNERIKKKIPMYHVYSIEAEPDFEDVGINKLPYTYSKHLPKGMLLPMSTTICGDEVQLKFWTRKGNVVIFKSPDIAEVYQSNFDHFWHQSTWVDQRMLMNLTMKDFSPVNRTAFITSYLTYDQIKEVGTAEEKDFFNLLDLSPVEADMKNYIQIRPGSPENVYKRYCSIKKAVEKAKPDLLLVCAAGLSPLGYSLRKKIKHVIDTDVKDLVLYRREVFGNKVETHSLDVLDKNDVAKIKKIIAEKKPKNMMIVVEGLCPYFDDEEELMMHENLKDIGSIAPTSVLLHYYVSTGRIAEETSATAFSGLFRDLAGLHRTKSDSAEKVIKYLDREYKDSVELTEKENPHKIFQCIV
jgi:sugar-specific transcriptional regulator TrmB